MYAKYEMNWHYSLILIENYSGMRCVHYIFTNYNIKNISTKFDSMYTINYYNEFYFIFNYKVKVKEIKYLINIFIKIVLLLCFYLKL